jgi:hypothetical protein
MSILVPAGAWLQWRESTSEAEEERQTHLLERELEQLKKAKIFMLRVIHAHETLNPITLNPKPYITKPLNPKPLNP